MYKTCKHCNGSGQTVDHEQLGAMMRKLRLQSKLSLREVARRLEFSAAYLSDLEQGKRNWSEKKIFDYRKALGLKIQTGDNLLADAVHVQMPLTHQRANTPKSFV